MFHLGLRHLKARNRRAVQPVPKAIIFRANDDYSSSMGYSCTLSGVYVPWYICTKMIRNLLSMP